MSDTDVHLWHPWLRINRVLRVMLHTRWRAEASGWTATDGHGQDAGPAGDLLLGESGLLHRDPPVPVEDRRSRHVLKSEMVQFHGGRSNEFETGVLTRQ